MITWQGGQSKLWHTFHTIFVDICFFFPCMIFKFPALLNKKDPHEPFRIFFLQRTSPAKTPLQKGCFAMNLCKSCRLGDYMLPIPPYTSNLNHLLTRFPSQHICPRIPSPKVSWSMPKAADCVKWCMKIVHALVSWEVLEKEPSGVELSPCQIGGAIYSSQVLTYSAWNTVLFFLNLTFYKDFFVLKFFRNKQTLKVKGLIQFFVVV